MTLSPRMKRELRRRRRQRQVYWWGPGWFGQYNLDLYQSRRRERLACCYAGIEIVLFCVLGALGLEKLAHGQLLATLTPGALAALNGWLTLRFVQDVVREQELQTGIKRQVDVLWESLKYAKARENGWSGETPTSGGPMLLH
jgi:hypothetical protein